MLFCFIVIGVAVVTAVDAARERLDAQSEPWRLGSLALSVLLAAMSIALARKEWIAGHKRSAMSLMAVMAYCAALLVWERWQTISPGGKGPNAQRGLGTPTHRYSTGSG